MEFFAALLFLCALNSFVFVPRGSTLFVGRGERFRMNDRSGWSFAGFWPSTSAVLAERPPWRVDEDQLLGRGIASRFFADGIARHDEPLTLHPETALARDGKAVLIDGDRYALARNEAAARRVLRYLQWGAGVGGEEGDASPVGSALAARAFEARRAGVRKATRWLRGLLDVYGLLLCVIVPGAAVLLDAESALTLGGPAILALHALAFALYWRAHRRVWPQGSDRRFENLVEVSLYPPALLRAARNLELDATEGFHPAAVASALLPTPPARAFARSEWLQTSRRAGGVSPLDVSLEEARQMRAMLEEVGIDPDQLLSAPARQDALAVAYCPACHAEYRRADGTCGDCDAPLTIFATAP